jgi:hypothetical protein
MKKIIIVIIAVILAIALSIAFIPSLFNNHEPINSKPIVEITYPNDGDTVSNIVTFSGKAMDPDGDQTIKHVEILINETWEKVEGIVVWSYTWNIFGLESGFYSINVRAWDGAVFSEIEEITLKVDNPEAVESNSHKWAVFIVAANFPKDNESKLGNGGLFLAEEMAAFFIENYNYPTSNIYILFDDGWIRTENGYGHRLQTLQERYHKYDITYGGATKEIVESTLKNVADESNSFEDSEVFIWIASHGCGDNDNPFTGGKILDQSGVYLWDEFLLTDKKLGGLLENLNSKKTCVIVDACFSGGFADKTIMNLPELFFFRKDVAKSGRVVITGASKFRVGYASTTEGPLFTQLWLEGIYTGDADGYKPGIFSIGRPTHLDFLKDGKVSVEEAFYYARYTLKNNELYKEYNKMEPQINDKYPRSGVFGSRDGLVLGE